jgi:hypothetical protein
MEVKEKHNRKVEVITDILCDCCGKSCKMGEHIIDNELREDHGEKFYTFEFLKLEAHWGYFSGKDMQHWIAQVCEECVDTKFTFIKFNKGKTRFSTGIV